MKWANAFKNIMELSELTAKDRGLPEAPCRTIPDVKNGSKPDLTSRTICYYLEYVNITCY